ncbi:MAG TPA: hypothetical protein VMW64_00860 [Dehalococcoidia bacterium]|nr:hypothetical protein [Dehalococcoidia bacterium]
MEPKAKDIFLTKLIRNGFSIEEKEDLLTLRPRKMEDVAKVIIQEVGANTWQVLRAEGQYAGFGRGKKKVMFENYVNRWAAEAFAQSVP